MKKPRSITALMGGAFVFILIGGALLYQWPPLRARIDWRIERLLAYGRGVLDPVAPMPTALPQPVLTTLPTASLPAPSATSTGSPSVPVVTLAPTETPTPSPTPPASTILGAPAYVEQTMNNCGPASLAMALSYYGWAGDQGQIAEVIKPLDPDRNVNPEEMVYYVRNYAGWLRAEFRVNGDLALLRRLVAAGFPVIIEESFRFEDPFWPEDDLWAAHYLLVTGYNDERQVFTVQDSFYGPNRALEYAQLDQQWKPFNRVYLLIYLPEQEAQIQGILDADWDTETNRQRALERSQADVVADPQDPYAWFNLGSNQVFFERYAEAAQAYDQARQLGLPQRMLRYQFGPFFAYFHTGRNDDLLTLTDYALRRTPNSEEALLWQGWGLYRAGKTDAAIASFRKALEHNPNYADASYALQFIGAAP